MAATLLAIKSKMLLPKEINEEGEEEDPRQELVEQLLEYKLYKYMSYELRDMQADAAYVMYKEPTIPAEVRAYRPEIDPAELLDGRDALEASQPVQDHHEAAERPDRPHPKHLRNAGKRRSGHG